MHKAEKKASVVHFTRFSFLFNQSWYFPLSFAFDPKLLYIFLCNVQFGAYFVHFFYSSPQVSCYFGSNWSTFSGFGSEFFFRFLVYGFAIGISFSARFLFWILLLFFPQIIEHVLALSWDEFESLTGFANHSLTSTVFVDCWLLLLLLLLFYHL